MTRRLRTWTSPVALYSRQRASASCEEILLGLVVLDCDFIGTNLGTEGTDGQGMYRVQTRCATSPLWGSCLTFWVTLRRIFARGLQCEPPRADLGCRRLRPPRDQRGEGRSRPRSAVPGGRRRAGGLAARARP